MNPHIKLHVPGHLTNPFPKAVRDLQAEIYEDLLKLHYGIISESQMKTNIAKDFNFDLKME